MKTFNDYRLQAARTLNSDLDPQLQLEVYGMGLAGESGEVIDLLKKHIGHSHPLDLNKLQSEIGDTLWYVAAITTRLKIGLDFDLNNFPIKYLGYSSTKLCLMLDRAIGRISHELIDFNSDFRSITNIHHLLWLVLDCLNATAQCYQITLVDCAEQNIDKLLRLYPDGFDSEKSLSRKRD